MKPELQNGISLAFIGDSYYDLKIREYLLMSGITKANELHKTQIKYSSGKAQCMIVDRMIGDDFLTDEEIDFYKKGRNANSNQRRNSISITEYKRATGFEALIGYLYLIRNFDRLEKIISKSIEIVNGVENENIRNKSSK